MSRKITAPHSPETGAAEWRGTARFIPEHPLPDAAKKPAILGG